MKFLRVVALFIILPSLLLAGPLTWTVTTAAHEGSVVDGFTLANIHNSGLSTIAPNDNFVAWRSYYNSGPNGGGAGTGAFSSDGSVVGYAGETIGGVQVGNYGLPYGLYVNDSHSVLFAAYAAEAGGGPLTYFTASSVLLASGGYLNNNHSRPLTLRGPFGYTDSGDFWAIWYTNPPAGVGQWVGTAAAGPLYAMPVDVNGPAYAAQNNSGAGIYAGTYDVARVYDVQGNIIAQPGTVIAGHTIFSIDYGTQRTPVAINNSGTVAFFAYYNGGNSCGIFTRTTLAVALPNSNCGAITAININDNGALAWYNLATSSIFTENGLITNQAGTVGPRFFNDIQSATWITYDGQIQIATLDATTPEPASFLLMFAPIGLCLVRRSRPIS